LTDDEIAALDGDWSGATPAERAAYAFTHKLTVEPHTVTQDDIGELKKRYTPTQVLEIVVTVAGYNSTNRWTDGLNIPAEGNGNFFRRTEGKVDLRSFQTPTSPEYAGLVSRIAPLPARCKAASPPAWPDRPALEDRATVEAKWRAAAVREPTLPLADRPGANWERLLATFPKAGAARAAGVKTAAEKGALSPRVRAEIAWAAARADRAWYALAVARGRLKALGFTDDHIFALDGDGKGLPEAELAAVAFARKLTAAPATVTDVDVEGLRKLFTDRQVAEIVHLVCTAAFFDRVTEAAGLPLDQ
jgi:alkylhydroperoxidase family enzyme